MTLTCPHCENCAVEEMDENEFVCHNCGREYTLEFTGKIYKEGE